MKILVADDDRLDRKLLHTCLEKAGYAVQSAEDGVAALRALVQPDAPTIALLDWSMPGLTGPEVCAKLRSVKLPVRPYMIMLTAKTDKPDVARALDAGADDFVTKPFNSGELLARLRVAQRTLDYQAELKRQLRDFAHLAERYNLLGEIAAQDRGETAAPAVGAAVAAPSLVEMVATAIGATPARPAALDRNEPAAEVVAPPPAPPPVGVLDLAEIAALTERFLHERGVGPVSRPSVLRQHARPPAVVAAWAGLILVREQLWIDLVLETELAAATSVFAKFLSSRNAAGGDLPGFLAEAQTIFSVMYKTALQDRGHELLTPFLSHARTVKGPLPAGDTPSSPLELQFDVGGAYLGVTIHQQACPPRVRTAAELRPHDVMAEAFPPAQADTVPFLVQGMVLTDRVIAKLSAYDEAKLCTHSVPVFEPTPLARQFCIPRD